uniref:Uncharacterized protein n=1 Tax=Chromera velia CCMP2878 TaxID=1169474 RepID=A0A0G4G5Z5_9ALVE|eukprot:Cvel_20433.t1-p1 / transcript=Cvel_20433.t1 / gene=Cvel_20433 / organism=Chromera_velia_CCMP2878 / gene_product=hypothetical protein / transcript_product=hypothetical protein / location=Cvel_scaffold1831:26195-35417(-) / protein_length=885 / sequence_SO=supercontig / SO=protein_coding / is_pseudo=false
MPTAKLRVVWRRPVRDRFDSETNTQTIMLTLVGEKMESPQRRKLCVIVFGKLAKHLACLRTDDILTIRGGDWRDVVSVASWRGCEWLQQHGQSQLLDTDILLVNKEPPFAQVTAERPTSGDDLVLHMDDANRTVLENPPSWALRHKEPTNHADGGNYVYEHSLGNLQEDKMQNYFGVFWRTCRGIQMISRGCRINAGIVDRRSILQETDLINDKFLFSQQIHGSTETNTIPFLTMGDVVIVHRGKLDVKDIGEETYWNLNEEKFTSIRVLQFDSQEGEDEEAGGQNRRLPTADQLPPVRRCFKQLSRPAQRVAGGVSAATSDLCLNATEKLRVVQMRRWAVNILRNQPVVTNDRDGYLQYLQHIQPLQWRDVLVQVTEFQAGRAPIAMRTDGVAGHSAGGSSQRLFVNDGSSQKDFFVSNVTPALTKWLSQDEGGLQVGDWILVRSIQRKPGVLYDVCQEDRERGEVFVLELNECPRITRIPAFAHQLADRRQMRANPIRSSDDLLDHEADPSSSSFSTGLLGPFVRVSREVPGNHGGNEEGGTGRGRKRHLEEGSGNGGATSGADGSDRRPYPSLDVDLSSSSSSSSSSSAAAAAATAAPAVASSSSSSSSFSASSSSSCAAASPTGRLLASTGGVERRRVFNIRSPGCKGPRTTTLEGIVNDTGRCGIFRVENVSIKCGRFGVGTEFSLGDMIRERETSRPSVRATNHQAGARDLPGNDEKELFFHVSFLLTDASGMDLCVEVCDQGEFFGITPREALNEDGQRERLQEMCTALLEPVAGRQPPLPKRRRDAPEAAAAAGTVPQSAPVPAEPGGHCFVIKKFSVVSSGNSQSQRTESLTQSARFSQSQGASAAAASQREPLPKTEVRYTVAPGFTTVTAFEAA